MTDFGGADFEVDSAEKRAGLSLSLRRQPRKPQSPGAESTVHVAHDPHDRQAWRNRTVQFVVGFSSNGRAHGAGSRHAEHTKRTRRIRMSTSSALGDRGFRPETFTPLPSSPSHADLDEPIDLASLLRRCLDDVTFCGMILHKFAARSADQLAALERALESGNAIELAREGAHAARRRREYERRGTCVPGPTTWNARHARAI